MMMPIQPRRAVPRGRTGRLVLAATTGRDTLDAGLNVLISLSLALEPGSIVLFDDGTLTGADRVRLARQCADPLIVSTAAVDRTGTFPAGPDWALLFAAPEQRRNAYWVITAAPPPEEALADLARAIASNRSFGILGDGTIQNPIEEHLGALGRAGLPYVPVSPNLLGLAACGDGLALARAVLARLEAVLGERARQPDVAGIVAGFILAGEREPVLIRDRRGAVHSPGSI